MSRLRWNALMPKPAHVAGISACAYGDRPESLDTPARG